MSELEAYELIALVLGSGLRGKNVLTLAKEVEVLIKNDPKKINPILFEEGFRSRIDEKLSSYGVC